MKLLGIDIGTSGTRAVLLDGDGRLVSSATAPHPPFASPHAGWAEQNPDDWWGAVCSAVPECLTRGKAAASEISGIALTGQMHGLVLLDRSGSVLRPSIIWCDQRTEVECREITEMVGAARLIGLTANPALTNFTLPKIWWVQKHELEIWARAGTILLPKDYIRLRLTGSLATDVADASGTLLFDVANRQWSQAMMEVSRLNADLLPKVFESCEISGHVSEEGARATGLRAGIPVVAGAGDQAAGAVGMGIVRAGAVSATIGTSGVVFAATAGPVRDPAGRIHTFCHAVPQRWHVMGVTQAAGYSLRWFRDQFGVSRRSRARRLRAIDGGSERGCGRRGWIIVGTVPDGRADTLSGPERARRAGGNFRNAHARTCGSRDPGGRGFQFAGHFHNFCRAEDSGRIHSPGWWRRARSFVAADSGGRLWHAGWFARGGGRCRLWRGVTRRSGRRQLDERRECRGCERAHLAANRAGRARRGADEPTVRCISQVVSGAAGRVACCAVSYFQDQDLKFGLRA